MYDNASSLVASARDLETDKRGRENKRWCKTLSFRVAKVISKTLDSLPELLGCLDDITSAQSNKEQLMYSAKLINATLAAVGGFKEMIRPGCNVQVDQQNND